MTRNHNGTAVTKRRSADHPGFIVSSNISGDADKDQSIREGVFFLQIKHGAASEGETAPWGLE